MSKKINTDDIANELATGSMFFGRNARPVTSDSDETEGMATPPAAQALPPARRPSASSRASTPDSTPTSNTARPTKAPTPV